MHANAKLYCGKCARFTSHVTQAKYDHWGALSKSVERCQVCLTETTPGNGHEIPATVDAPNELTTHEIAYCWYFRHLIDTGRLTEWPRDWWDMQTPGVWG